MHGAQDARRAAGIREVPTIEGEMERGEGGRRLELREPISFYIGVVENTSGRTE